MGSKGSMKILPMMGDTIAVSDAAVREVRTGKTMSCKGGDEMYQ